MASQTIGTVNEEGQNVDLYIPRKCHASKRLIPAFDHGAIQIAIGDVDENGQYTGTSRIMCISGFLRSQGESDHSINHLCIGHGVIRGKTARQPKWLKKRQADARKKFATKKGGRRPPAKRPFGKGARPAGKFPPRGAADGKRPPRPDGKRPPRAEGERPPRPAGERGPRPAGDAKRPPRPEAKAAPRPPRPSAPKAAGAPAKPAPKA